MEYKVLLSQPCLFGSNCFNVQTCSFLHSQTDLSQDQPKEPQSEQQPRQQQLPSRDDIKPLRKTKILCKWGNKCNRKDCYFNHPFRNQSCQGKPSHYQQNSNNGLRQSDKPLNNQTPDNFSDNQSQGRNSQGRISNGSRQWCTFDQNCDKVTCPRIHSTVSTNSPAYEIQASLAPRPSGIAGGQTPVYPMGPQQNPVFPQQQPSPGFGYPYGPGCFYQHTQQVPFVYPQQAPFRYQTQQYQFVRPPGGIPFQQPFQPQPQPKDIFEEIFNDNNNWSRTFSMQQTKYVGQRSTAIPLHPMPMHNPQQVPVFQQPVNTVPMNQSVDDLLQQVKNCFVVKQTKQTLSNNTEATPQGEEDTPVQTDIQTNEEDDPFLANKQKNEAMDLEMLQVALGIIEEKMQNDSKVKHIEKEVEQDIQQSEDSYS